ncbi:hypothetical protein AWB78_02373 [Caballeronia calidae]|uniref:Uncharacterized protein n=1 Tax=Caballeronia calidae TaxID=1777139 RepID=A0A158B7T9_9BURK|nr:hypothetical protein [Caballeronia calidae]SAK65970.1 hypothetical protein AWB78_02373 [Caballeronia calidae]
MTISAVVRVVPDKNTGTALPEPSTDKLQAAANVLVRLGFVRVRTLSFGVSFLGQPDDFKRVFDVELREGQAFAEEIRPMGELADLVDRLEVTPPAILYA